MDKLVTTRKQKSKAAETRMLAASMTTKWFFGLRKEWPHKKIHFFFVLWCKLIASGQIIMTQDWNCPHNVKTFCSKSLANLRVLYIYVQTVLLWYSSEGIYTPLFFPSILIHRYWYSSKNPTVNKGQSITKSGKWSIVETQSGLLSLSNERNDTKSFH